MTKAALMVKDRKVTTQGAFNILSVENCWDRLNAEQFGRLAVSVAGRPDIYPVNYIVHDQRLVFRTAEGTKLASMAINTAVAFEIDGYEAETNTAWSVVLHGHARLVQHGAEAEALESLPLFPWNTSPKHRLVQVEPVEVTGRSFIAEGRHG